MVSEVSLQDVLRIEDTPELLEFSCPSSGLPIWPLIRLPFLRFILADLCYGAALVKPVEQPSKIKALKALGRASWHNAHTVRGARSPVLLMGTGLGDYLKDGRWFNRLTDYFAEQSDGAYVVQDFWAWRWPFPRHNPHVLFHAPHQVAAAIGGKLQVREVHRRMAAELVGLVSERGRNLLAWDIGPDRQDFLRRMLARHMAAIPMRQAAYARLLRRLGVKLLLKEEACYGPSMVLMATARDMGVVTAEYQHGMVSAGMDAYNFSPALLGHKALKTSLPDYFLAYGKWWGEQINVPVSKVTIGNPHRSARIDAATIGRGSGNDILVLGDGIETVLYLDLCVRIAAVAGNRYRVVFRPHPMEQVQAAEIMAQHGQGVVLDTHSDIYKSFRTAQAVISEVSTGLFEAVGLVPRVFIWNTAKARFCFPSFPFESIDGAEDVAARLDGVAGDSVAPGDIWENHWQQHYRDFVGRALGQPAVISI